ncbi:hypothetical protein FQA39_LY18774 [Lamprigera yunnana]|nr:hypothetical protein FQA39_LY18774 [Lamprigera yunnana]
MAVQRVAREAVTGTGDPGRLNYSMLRFGKAYPKRTPHSLPTWAQIEVLGLYPHWDHRPRDILPHDTVRAGELHTKDKGLICKSGAPTAESCIWIAAPLSRACPTTAHSPIGQTASYSEQLEGERNAHHHGRNAAAETNHHICRPVDGVAASELVNSPPIPQVSNIETLERIPAPGDATCTLVTPTLEAEVFPHVGTTEAMLVQHSPHQWRRYHRRTQPDYIDVCCSAWVNEQSCTLQEIVL